MGFWSTIGKIGLAALPVIGSAAGAYSSGQAQNRGQKFGGQLELERLLMDRERSGQDMRIAREQEGRAGSSDAWRKLLASQRTLFPGAKPQLSPYSVKPREMTAYEESGADAMGLEALLRLQAGNPIPQVTNRPSAVDPSLLEPGALERILGIVGMARGISGPAKSGGVATYG